MSPLSRYQNPELQDQLAAQYVLGTLRGPARRRMQTLMQQIPALQLRVRHWENQLQPLNDSVAELPPAASVWAGIDQAINPAAASDSGSLIESLKQRLNLWRYLTATGFAFALVLGVLLTLQLNQPASNSASGVVNYVAVMKNSDDQPSMVVTLVQEGRQLSLDMLQKPVIADDQVLHLWAISKEDGHIRSLGTIPVEKHIEKTLSKPQWGMISSAEHLIVSVETTAQVLTPGPDIIAKGLCVKVEGWQAKTG
ncbi:MAG TPA: hypothetical protein DEA26_02325 [Oceanospirillales bacterium]|nr:hypothetical protein [Oceanospirillaceae bacterium]MAR02192.1 hypothetical protein [Oceanospirillaceae bacterium]HBS41489.1 hypothetical protein [Oceanospirillales bacterium]|tara:strand:- start:651 stop:1409 length:759 start_codon:yes stop_codon:yes gene_type:complete